MVAAISVEELAGDGGFELVGDDQLT